MKNCFLLLLLFIPLFANEDSSPIPPMSSGVESIGIFADCIDVVTGAYIGSKPEVTVNCHEPITLYRQLVSCSDGLAGEVNESSAHWSTAPSTSFSQLGKEFIKFSSGRHKKDTRF